MVILFSFFFEGCGFVFGQRLFVSCYVGQVWSLGVVKVTLCFLCIVLFCRLTIFSLINSDLQSFYFCENYDVSSRKFMKQIRFFLSFIVKSALSSNSIFLNVSKAIWWLKSCFRWSCLIARRSFLNVVLVQRLCNIVLSLFYRFAFDESKYDQVTMMNRIKLRFHIFFSFCNNRIVEYAWKIVRG